MSKENWLPQDIDYLINFVQNNPEIYDTTLPGYCNRTIIDQLWDKVGTEIKKSGM